MSESISDIQKKLSQVTSENDSVFQLYLQDERKGVQKLLISLQKKWEKEAILVQKLTKMKQYENDLYQQGYKCIAGVDEVGRGPLAGPVVAAAVILPEDFSVVGINDSKQLSEVKRETLFELIKQQAIAVGVGIIEHDVIDEVNIYEATKLAMRMALDELDPSPDFILIDAMPLKYTEAELSLIKGDTKSISIAAASIIAKVTRDRLMKDYDVAYPGYDFLHNMGYGTKNHLNGLNTNGVCPIHRLSFAPVKEAKLHFESLK
ncbi:ribonuclease HII [Listeria seeligeri]|uniref:ribonuclease HII n=1 Tax=Listeria seeligeri TaxID=1640 RepID=UPI0016290C8F|nr:ribonuclease HII [Listeria seeligeri]MBC1730124.1 ribonuclease HII [Listeria seeligeri]MBC1848492.1 ribonuclease HII [Listeria seeligeri]MBC1856424.1 ribonuclease HII [Listeria seeligeri]MBC1870707.1 ribonuclease HII [Listeria seeligeri]MBC2222065.1 ribonuclease HII [Listeria seeligeri]